jgi:hypothetical protein
MTPSTLAVSRSLTLPLTSLTPERLVAKTTKPTLDLPPFPPLTWDGYSWTADVDLPAWRRFVRNDGRMPLMILIDNEDQAPEPWQGEAYRYVIDHDKALADTIVCAVMQRKPWVDEDDDDEEDEEPRLRIATAGDLLGRFRLDTILIQHVVREGIAYVGFQFRCDWEREHGLGVMMHRDRIVRLGGAADAFLAWIAERDAREANAP